MRRCRRVQVACIIALVLGFHLTGLWFLVATSRVIVRRADLQGLQIVFIARPPASPEQPRYQEQKLSGHEAPRESLRHRASSKPQPTQQSAPPEEESHAIHPPIDWAAELSQTAKDAAADKSAQAPRDFGFPHLPAAPGKEPLFDWDYAATHRVEQIDGGGLLVHLNDNCVLVLFPLPFIGCGIGTKPANGELFKNMGAPKEAQPGIAP
jgi:hypothetical protein